MKVVLDTMLWVSYCTRRRGSRHRLIESALKAKVRLFVSDYILGELTDVLQEVLGESPRFAYLARRAVLRRAKLVALPKNIRHFVPGDPKDDAVVQTAVSSKSDYLVTADALLLELGKVRNVDIISTSDFAERLPKPL
ncbi:MAG TPA: putative toxin-antitoxin system toxin component, PIN family [Gemmataceae bacterium]|nr:putative toxin-antitoxin system toxin component, PIN family [Gemmataceae bacterium]